MKWMLDLEWNINDLKNAKEYLESNEKNSIKLAKKRPKYVQNVNDDEWKHLKNCINFWEDKLK
jgi:hypothetical protein